MNKRGLIVVAAIVALIRPTVAGTFVSGSDGSDGTFNPRSDVVVDLSLADFGSWDTPGNGNGVYDPDRWLVVFKFTTISIPPGVTVTFLNHPSGAPVAWLAQGDVLIDGFGEVELDGEDGDPSSIPYFQTEPGPGGFAGGTAQVSSFPASDGFGPGGGSFGSVGFYTYGNPSIFPLIGGSGGGGGIQHVAGAGGGALLIASSGTIALDGVIRANGGDGSAGSSGGGSGGGIRLVANAILGTGQLSAQSSAGSNGRIRLEAFDVSAFMGSSIPAAIIGGPGQIVQDDLTPTLRASMVDDQLVPLDPTAGVLTKEVVADSDIVTLTIEATNVPPGTVVEVTVTPAHGASFTVISTPLSGGLAFSTATALVDLPSYPADIQLRATF